MNGRKNSTDQINRGRPIHLFRALFSLGLLAILLVSGTVAAKAASDAVFPDTIPLPNGFNPEGIVIGRGTTFYVGSIISGDIYMGDLRTGQGEILVHAPAGCATIGLSYDSRTNWIYAAGGPTGAAYIYDAATGETVAGFQFTTEPTFVNDVVVTQRAAYFTDSYRPYLYEVPLNPDGSLAGGFQEIYLDGDFSLVPNSFNANGIDATPNGKYLIVVQSSTGELFRVDPDTGEVLLIDLGGDTVLNGDGILLDGKTLYVVQNANNQISVIELAPDLLSGEVVNVITNAAFEFPTTIDDFGNALYVVNARLDLPVTPETEYQILRVVK